MFEFRSPFDTTTAINLAAWREFGSEVGHESRTTNYSIVIFFSHRFVLRYRRFSHYGQSPLTRLN
jgi:hypothetical protein